MDAKTSARVSDGSEPFQAILLADCFTSTDSFSSKFLPMTLERPKVLLPLVNAPMIEYTLRWLESAGVEGVFVLCPAQSNQVITYLESSQWLTRPNFPVRTIDVNNCTSAGDALRSIYKQDLIQGDFVIVSGDTVSNMSLTPALQEHKERRKKGLSAVMTMVIKQSKPSPVTRQSRFGTDELFGAIDPTTKQLLSYEENANCSSGTISLDKILLVDNSSVSLHSDMQDCHIDICSPEVLGEFGERLDYQHLRRHFVKGVLVDNIMGYKIFTHEIHSCYAARIDNYRDYDTVSKDIIQRWTYPFVPDVLFMGNSAPEFERHGVYKGSDIELALSAHIGHSTVIGHCTKIGSNSRISNSVIGNGCSIGSNVLIEGSYLWDNVTIEDGCEMKHSIVCDGVVLKSGAVLNPGVVLSFKVVVGTNFKVPAYSMASSHQQPIEYSPIAESSDAFYEDLLLENDKGSYFRTNYEIEADIGEGGFGSIWRCRNRISKQICAVKRVIRSKAKLYRACREAEALACLDHSNVVRYFHCWIEKAAPEDLEKNDSRHIDTEEEEGEGEKEGEKEYLSLFIAMELCERNLSDHLMDRALVEDPFAIARCLADTLIYIHSENVIHRDLSSVNVFIKGETFKIGDFGLAAIIGEGNVAFSSKGDGNKLYIAPEIEDGRCSITTKADIYSLGMIFYELFHNFPTASEKWKAMACFKKTRNFKDESRLPEDLERLILLMTAPNPDERPGLEVVREALGG